MKLKIDFITNSSSTSFIMRDQTTSQIALLMLDIIEDEYSKDDDKWRIPPIVIRWLNENIESNIPLLIPWSYNYETFIYPDWFGKIRIDTCNNHHFYQFLDIEYIDENSEYDYNENIIFLNLENFVMTKRKDYEIYVYLQPKFMGDKF